MSVEELKYFDTVENIPEISAIIPFEGENLMYIPMKFGNLRRRALIDTGACANAMPSEFYEKLKNESPDSLSELQLASFFNVKVASRSTVKVLAQIEVNFMSIIMNFRTPSWYFLR